VTFEDKVALRSRVVVRAGRPIDPAGPAYRTAAGEPVGSADHDRVRALTAEIRGAIADVSPDFEDLIAAVEMRRAADVALRSDDLAPLGEVSLAEREALAKDLDRLPSAVRDPIAIAAGEYQLLLSAVRIGDDYLAPPVKLRSLVARALATAVAFVLLIPFALMGVVVNVVPAVLGILAGLVATAPVSKGTNRVLVGIVAFPLTWWLVAAGDAGRGIAATVVGWVTWPLDPVVEALVGTRGGFWPSLLVFVACPICGLLAVWLAEQLVRLLRTVRAVSTTINRRGQVHEVLERRTGLVELVTSATGDRA
jgi:hypothetical protein